MSTLFSFFTPKPDKPEPVAPTPTPIPKKEKKGRRAQLIALKATGPSGLLDEANIGRRKILI